MYWTHRTLLVFASLYLLFLLFYLRPDLGLLSKGPVDYHVALVTEQEPTGVEHSVKLFSDEFNASAKQRGVRLVLDIYRDDGTPEQAKQNAERIAASNAVAVIGHPDSTSSLIAGEIYRDKEIPAISVQATNYAVTRSNPWYFRTIFNDRDQGILLSNYMHHVLHADEVYIIHSGDAYGEYLADMAKKVMVNFNTPVISTVRLIDGQPLDTEQVLEPLQNHRHYLQEKFSKAEKKYQRELVRNPDTEGLVAPTERRVVVFLAVSPSQGLKLITTMRDAGITYPVVGTESLSTHNFSDALVNLPFERSRPGYYTRNLYLTTPFSFDLANRDAQRFKHRYRKKYGHLPGWQAIYAHDAVHLITSGIETLIADNKGDQSVKQLRQELRRFLAGVNSEETAIEGITGSNYFDAGGDVERDITVLNFQRGHLSVAPLQIYPSPDPFDQGEGGLDWRTDDPTEHGLQVNKRQVFYTSVRVNAISDIDMSSLKYSMDLDVWFRGSDYLDEDDIELLNGADGLQLGYASDMSRSNGISYSLFQLKGEFKADFMPNDYPLGTHILGLSFQHTGLDAEHLLFVTDYRGMGMVGAVKGRPVLEQMKEQKVVAADSGWLQSDLYIYHDMAGRHSLGKPDRIRREGGYLDYSRFNMEIVVVPDGFNIYTLLNGERAEQLIVVLVGVALLLFWLLLRVRSGWLNHIIWLLQTMLLVLLAVSIQVLVVSRLHGQLLPFHVRTLSMLFNVFWWFFGALIFDLMIRQFIWRTLEETAAQTVPALVKNFTSFVIFSLAVLAVIAFVYEQKVTGLLATSGVLAMIIGLAVQMNIANIFSGIAINIEAPFRPGDWVRIGDFPEARVFDITWRATRLLTRDDHLLCIPNHLAAESTIHNYSQPDSGPMQHLQLDFPANIDPQRVRKILLDALLSTREVLGSPAPQVTFSSISGDSASYTLHFHLRDYQQLGKSVDKVWERLWIHLRRSELPSPINLGNPLLDEPGRSEVEAILDALGAMELFHTLPTEDRMALAEQLHIDTLPAGHNLIEVGGASDSMFLLLEGASQVLMPTNKGRMVEIRRIGVGAYFGEISLLSGEPRSATITTLSETKVVEISREQVMPLLERSPELPKLLEQEVIRRIEESEERVTEVTAPPPPKSLLVRLLLALFGKRKKTKE